MKKIMPRLIGFLIILIFLVSPVLAQGFVKSTQNPNPYIIDGFVGYKDDNIEEIIPNARVYIKNLRTEYTLFIYTNENGYFLYDLRNLLVPTPWDDAYKGGDEIEVYLTTDKKYKFQIGGKERCNYYGGEDCESLASGSGGHSINFNVGSADYVFYKDIPEPITGKEWYDTYKAPVAIITAMILILAAVMVALYYKDKSKYRWMPGMAGILKWQLKNWVKAYNSGDEELADKLRKTLYKTADTITRKYIRSVENGTIEPGV